MDMKLVTHPDFSAYGHVVEGYDFAPLLDALRSGTERPADRVIYVPTDPALEATAVFAQIQDNFYGGMPVQFGYCNGSNHALGCLEYHRGCEVNVAADDVVLLVAPKKSIQGGRLRTAEVEAFLLPAGQAVVLYETTLHYAPCNAPGGEGFRVVIVLPRGTNTDKPSIDILNSEDNLLWARNKWLLAHPEAPEAAQGAHVGLVGENVTV